MTWTRTSLRRVAIPVLAVCGVVYFLCTDFRAGWIRSTTDFPNYYTAARLVRSGERLRDFYDWTWFQRQMNYAGFERQLGAYTPQPPLTMLPMVPIAGLAPQTAKRIWLVLNLLFLAATVLLLSKTGRLQIPHITLLLLAAYPSLRANFVLGQYYVFLLFLLTLTFVLSKRHELISSGVVAGLAFALKLYGGPLLFYFAAKRYWKAAASMIGATVAAVAVAIAVFGWADVHFYATQILPRTLEGVPPDPYHSGVQTVSTLLRRLFVSDPELNPSPLYNAPWLEFFLQPLISLGVVLFVTLAVALKRTDDCARDFALFTIALVLISTSVSSYTFLLLLLPITLSLEDAGPRESVYLVASYILLNAPLPGAHLFPKVWLLFGLLAVVGLRYWSALSPRTIAAGLACIATLAALKAHVAIQDYRNAPDKRCQLVSVAKGSLFVGFPAITNAGLFCQAQRRDRYILRWQHGTTVEDLSFDGQAFHPAAPDPAGPIYFELVAHGTSKMMQFDPATRKATTVPGIVNFHPGTSATSPDGTRIAFTENTAGSEQILIKNVATGVVKRLTGGNCNNSQPAWELDGKAIVFASDCGRSVGLSALYRISVRPVL